MPTLLWSLPNLLLVLLWLAAFQYTPDLRAHLPVVGLAWFALTPLAAGLLDRRWGSLFWILASAAGLFIAVGALLITADANCADTIDCMSHSGFLWVFLIAAALGYPILAVALFTISRALTR